MDNFFSRLVLSDEWRYRLSRHVLFWLCCWAFMGFIYGFLYVDEDQKPQFVRSYIESFIYLPQHMVLSYGIIYLALPRYILKNRYWAGISIIVCFILVAAICSPAILIFILNPIQHALNYPVKHSSIFFSFMGGLRGSSTIAGFAVAIKLVKYWYFKKEENAALEKEKLKAELQLLRGQLHPHFVFNTLNSIYSLSLKNSPQTPGAILKLADLMRYMFTDCSAHSISLTKEVEMLQNYIDLVRSRYNDRIDMAVNIDGFFGDKLIAPLIFLPFVENSFKYGANEMLESAWISIDLSVDGHTLKFKVMNGKPSGIETISSGVGLRNVKKRLQMLYPGAHELRITEDDDSFIVALTLELDKHILSEKNEAYPMFAGG
ncbi:MAG TPA: sensor histidine kinase [Chryseosolibacter sp.]